MTMCRISLLAGLVLSLGACAAGQARVTQAVAIDAPANSDAAWARLDTDHDGYLTVTELEEQHATGLLQDMHAADANGDNRISQREWGNWWPRMTHTKQSQSMERLNRSSIATPQQ